MRFSLTSLQMLWRLNELSTSAVCKTTSSNLNGYSPNEYSINIYIGHIYVCMYIYCNKVGGSRNYQRVVMYFIFNQIRSTNGTISNSKCSWVCMAYMYAYKCVYLIYFASANDRHWPIVVLFRTHSMAKCRKLTLEIVHARSLNS